MTIRFVSVVGADTGLLDSAITHYRGLGVDAFHIARHIESFDDPDFRRSQDVVARHGISFAAVHQGPWDEDLNGYLIWAQYPLAGFVTLRLPGGDWHLTYPDTVDESRRMLQHLEANGGRIDVTAEELSLHRCGSDYSDYEAWPELVSRLEDIR